MRGAFAMNEDAQIGIFAKQRPSCAGMVEMNVGEQDGVEVRDGESARPATARARFPKWMPGQDRELRSGRSDSRSTAPIECGRPIQLRSSTVVESID